MNSLRVRLLVIIGISLVAMWSVVAAWMMVQLRSEVRTALDERLAASARMVAGLASQLPTPVATGARLGPQLDVIARDGLACEVSLLRGELSMEPVARTAGSPGLQELAPGYGTRVFGGKPWRTYVLHQGPIRVATADRIDLREALLRDVALTAGVPFAFAVVGSLALLWFAIGGGLAPLERMRMVLSARKPDDDSPLPQLDVPREMQPLVGTIGRLLQRVRGTIERERRFTDDAAHELRTPLTAIKTHLQVLRLTLGLEARRRGGALSLPVAEALDHSDAGVVRMQHTIEQLLLLARVDGEDAAAAAETSEPLAAVRQAVSDAEAACGCAGRVTVDAAAGLPAAVLPQPLLVSALRNLLDNALRLGPAGSPVLLRVQARGPSGLRFEVVDEGPGLSEAECAMATSRFWRRAKSGSGSGLGLAIVAAIAQRYGGALQLRPGAQRGLVARLELPAST